MKPRTFVKDLIRDQSLCRACGEVFNTTNNFDRHRKGSYKLGTRHCVDPESVGMRIRTIKGGQHWTRPLNSKSLARIQNVKDNTGTK